MIIDSHVHVWPDRIAKLALANPLEEMERHGDGTVAGSVEAMDRAGIDRSISLGVADSPARLDKANAYAASLDPDRFVGFGSVHPGRSVADNLDSLRRHRLRGAKLHPLFQGYALDDPRLGEILDAMQGEFAIIAHVGHGDTPEGNARATPAMMARLVREYPRLDIVAAHFGGYLTMDEAEELIMGLPVFVDTSWPPSLAAVEPKRVRRFIERHGPERVSFATDWPMADPAREREAIEALGLAEDDVAAVLGGNIGRLLDLG
jgi:predicted TIM-barrel fold metal-dependent hydrolase